jgi:hypothetical protein
MGGGWGGCGIGGGSGGFGTGDGSGGWGIGGSVIALCYPEPAGASPALDPVAELGQRHLMVADPNGTIVDVIQRIPLT